MSTIFISSTFQDMQQERDALQSIVLPKIKEFVKQYGKNIELCDLRWGVNSMDLDEEGSTKKVLQVCFDEIDNARPFFIALIGDRYGWVPPKEITVNSIASQKLSLEELEDKSVTELEIIYGAMKSPQDDSVRFYFREIENKKRWFAVNKDIPQHFLSLSEEDKKRMQRLKRYIRDRFFQRLRSYSVSWNKDTGSFDGMDAFAGMVCEDLKEMIRSRWGEPKLLSDYDRQYMQYQYAIQADDLLAEHAGEFFAGSTNYQIKQLGNSAPEKQIYVLVSQEEDNLNRIFASLCTHYEKNNAEIIPYECSQSVLSSSVKNLACYFSEILSKRFLGDSSFENLKEANTTEEYILRMHEVLKAVDEKASQKMILAIRGVKHLDYEDVFKWMPLTNYQNIYFLLSMDKSIAGPSAYTQLSKEFFFEKSKIFERNLLIDIYMKHFHKEIDDNVREAIYKKSEQRDETYMELLMQKLLVFTEEDFRRIREKGDGIEQISKHLQWRIKETPDNSEDIILEQIRELEQETSEKFVKSVLAILCVLPFGISLELLQKILAEEEIEFNTLYFSMLCRRLPVIVNETLNGYYRMRDSSASEFLRQTLIVEKIRWSRILDKYLTDCVKEGTYSENSVMEIYKSQYLQVAMQAGNGLALGNYLKNLSYDVEYTALILQRLLKEEKNVPWLKKNLFYLGVNDLGWLTKDVYHYLSDAKIVVNKEFAKSLLELFKTMLQILEVNAEKENSEAANYRYFRALYAAAELAHIHEWQEAEKYLLRAKMLSKENFLKYPNRLWKMVHGIELTEEEKHRGHDMMQKDGIETDLEGVLLGFQGEVEDMELEQSWSIEIRVINNYLAQLYRRTGQADKAKQLEEESKNITHMSDPDPKHQGQNQISSGVKIIWPDELDENMPGHGNGIKKRAYQPDLRRNSAIQMSKEAARLADEGRRAEALERFKEANAILLEIYEDGESREFYDLHGIVGNPEEQALSVQKECARDLGINHRQMLRCIEIDSEEEYAKQLAEEMISWALIYDDYRNNKQSKSTLEEYYLVSANIYYAFENMALYAERIIDDLDKYYTYRLEAHRKGERTDRSIMENREYANRLFYATVTSNPQFGNRVTDLLLRQSNDSVKANDFDGFVVMTVLIGELLCWMWNNGYQWKGSLCSLESIFCANISNQCMLWAQHNMKERLEHDAKKLTEMIDNIVEAENVLRVAESIHRYQMLLFGEGKYEEACKFSSRLIDSLRRVKAELLKRDIVIIYEHLMAAYSEAGHSKEAEALAVEMEQLLEEMEAEKYPEQLKEMGIFPEAYRLFIRQEKAILFMNRAILYSRMGNETQGMYYLECAGRILEENPELAIREKGLKERVELFRKNGLPKAKEVRDAETEYRRYKEKIESMLEHCLQGKYSAYDLMRIEIFVQKLCEMPEHAIFGSPHIIAGYYHFLSMLYQSIGKKQVMEMLNLAREQAELDGEIRAVYGRIYGDLCAYAQDDSEKMYCAKKAIDIYERLRKEGKEFSSNDYAMALYNFSILLAANEDMEQALRYARNAFYIWEELCKEEAQDSIRMYRDEAKRLMTHLEKNL